MKLPFVRNFSIRIKYSLPTMHFFTPEGRITDDLPLRGEIFESLKHYAINNVPRKVTNILEVMKLAAYVEDFPPEANKIHARLRADYENLQNLMNCIPPEILELAKRGQLTHSDRKR